MNRRDRRLLGRGSNVVEVLRRCLEVESDELLPEVESLWQVHMGFFKV